MEIIEHEFSIIIPYNKKLEMFKNCSIKKIYKHPKKMCVRRCIMEDNTYILDEKKIDKSFKTLAQIKGYLVNVVEKWSTEKLIYQPIEGTKWKLVDEITRFYHFDGHGTRWSFEKNKIHVENESVETLEEFIRVLESSPILDEILYNIEQAPFKLIQAIQLEIDLTRPFNFLSEEEISYNYYAPKLDGERYEAFLHGHDLFILKLNKFIRLPKCINKTQVFILALEMIGDEIYIIDIVHILNKIAYDLNRCPILFAIKLLLKLNLDGVVKCNKFYKTRQEAQNCVDQNPQFYDGILAFNSYSIEKIKKIHTIDILYANGEFFFSNKKPVPKPPKIKISLPSSRKFVVVECKVEDDLSLTFLKFRTKNGFNSIEDYDKICEHVLVSAGSKNQLYNNGRDNRYPEMEE